MAKAKKSKTKEKPGLIHLDRRKMRTAEREECPGKFDLKADACLDCGEDDGEEDTTTTKAILKYQKCREKTKSKPKKKEIKKKKYIKIKKTAKKKTAKKQTAKKKKKASKKKKKK